MRVKGGLCLLNERDGANGGYCLCGNGPEFVNASPKL